MILMHLCNRPDVTFVQNKLLKFLHVWEGGHTLGEDDHHDVHIGDRDCGHVGDRDDNHVGDRDGGVHVRERGRTLDVGNHDDYDVGYNDGDHVGDQDGGVHLG